VSAILSTIRYRDFIAKGEASGVLVTAGTSSSNPWEGIYPGPAFLTSVV